MAKKKETIKEEINFEFTEEFIIPSPTNNDQVKIDPIVEEPVVEESKSDVHVIEYKDLSELSKSEYRSYLRTGILPEKNKTVNRYTRFDTENIKFGF